LEERLGIEDIGFRIFPRFGVGDILFDFDNSLVGILVGFEAWSGDRGDISSGCMSKVVALGVSDMRIGIPGENSWVLSFLHVGQIDFLVSGKTSHPSVFNFK